LINATDQELDDHVSAVICANSIAAAAIDFLNTVAGGMYGSAIKLPLKQPLQLFRTRVRQAYERRLIDLQQ
jgi:hypothetical protein